MKQVKVKIETAVEATLDGKPVYEILKDIADLCRKKIQYSTSKDEECEMLYEDQLYEDYRNAMEDRVTVLEGALSQILNFLGD